MDALTPEVISHESTFEEIVDFINDSSTIKNVTANVTQFDSFYFYEKEQLTTLWILLISIVLGNSSVLLALLFSKGRRSRVNYFIMHLAIADLSVGLVSVLTDIIWKITIEWNAGNIACKVVRFSQVVVTYSSTYVLVALSIDRYDAIRHPMNFSGSWKRAKVLILAAWALSFLFSVPIIVFYEEKEIEGHTQCWIEFQAPWQWQVYMTSVAITIFVVPACIIASCYAIIIYTIWSKSSILSQKKTKHKQNGASSTSLSDNDCKRVSSRGLIPKAKIKTIKMTLLIVFVFILCWSPYIVFDLLQVYGYIANTQTNVAVATFIQSLAPLNSAANPLIYCVFSTSLCRNLSNLFPFKYIPRAYDNTRLGRSAKVTDTTSMTEVTQVSKRYIHLHNLARLDNLSTYDRKVLKSSGRGLESSNQLLAQHGIDDSIFTTLSVNSPPY